VASSRKPNGPARPPATTRESREHQLINLAMDLAEKQIADGKASSQVITHFLKLGTVREELERDRLKEENELLKAKVKSLASAESIEALYKNALAAMSDYQGREEIIDD
jgi:hypothetical protein